MPFGFDPRGSWRKGPMMSPLITPIPDTGLDDWQKLVSFRPPGTIQVGVNTRFGGLFGGGRPIHRVEDGSGPINLDYYPVRVDNPPSSGGHTMTPNELLEHVRRNLGTFVDSVSGCTFDPYDAAIDNGLWAPPFLTTGWPGAILSIGMFTAGILVDRGSVVLAEIGSDHWIFSTLWTPQDQNHPVSGNREWGYAYGSDGALYLYTRGADRCTTFIDDFLAETVFVAADVLWRSLQLKLAAFVNANGGSATVYGPSSHRYDWPEIQARYFAPQQNWL